MFIHHEKYLAKKFVKTTIIDALFYFVIYIYVGFFSPYLNSIGWSESMKGIFFALFSIFGIFLAPVVGNLSDKFGRYNVMMIGIITEIIALIGYILFTNVAILFFIRFLSAVAFNSVVISALARINDSVENINRSQATGVFHSFISISVIVAPLLGGVIADAFGYKNLFIVALSCMVLILISLFIYDYFKFNNLYPHKKRELLNIKDFNPWKSVKIAFQFKELRIITILGAFSNFTSPIIFLVLPYFIMGKMGLTNTHLSIAIFLVGLAHAFQFLLGKLAVKINNGRSIVFGLGLTALFYFSFFFVHSYYVLLFLVFFQSLSYSLWNVSAWTFMSEIGEKHNIEGKVVGSYTSIIRASISISYLVCGFILEKAGEYIFFLYGLVILIPVLITSNFFLTYYSSKRQMSKTKLTKRPLKKKKSTSKKNQRKQKK